MKRNLPMILIVAVLSLILVLSLVFSAASFALRQPTSTPEPTIISLPTNTPAPTNTPDACSPEGIPQQVERLHALTREFDDTFGLAQTLRIDETVSLVQDMQRTKRNAEDQNVPACLAKLKEYQLLYMNAGIEVFTTVYAITSSNPNLNQNQLNSVTIPLLENVLSAGKLYVDEQSKLMGWTPVPFPTLEGSTTATVTP
jgi:hypothetical protein